jgi:hypothetical protein
MATDDPLEHPVSAGGTTKPFGTLTAAEVRARADELSAAVGWGPTARVAPVARAWGALARQMDEAHAATVTDLGEDAAAAAERLWVVPPGGSLL